MDSNQSSYCQSGPGCPSPAAAPPAAEALRGLSLPTVMRRGWSSGAAAVGGSLRPLSVPSHRRPLPARPHLPQTGEVGAAESRRSAEGLRRDGSQRRSNFGGSYSDSLLRERWRLVGRRRVCRRSRRIQDGGSALTGSEFREAETAPQAPTSLL